MFQFQDYINIFYKEPPELVPLSKHFITYSQNSNTFINHNPSQWLCEPHPLPMFQLYILSSSVCVQAEHNGNISLELLLYGSTGWYRFLGSSPYISSFHYSLPIHTVRGKVCTHVHFRVNYREIAVLRTVGVQTDIIHITDFFPLFDCSMFSWHRFFPRTRYLEYLFENVYIGLRAIFIFEVRIVTQGFFKLAPQD